MLPRKTPLHQSLIEACRMHNNCLPVRWPVPSNVRSCIKCGVVTRSWLCEAWDACTIEPHFLITSLASSCTIICTTECNFSPVRGAQRSSCNEMMWLRCTKKRFDGKPGRRREQGEERTTRYSQNVKYSNKLDDKVFFEKKTYYGTTKTKTTPSIWW